MYLVPIFSFEYIFPSITLQFWNLQVQQGARSSWIKNKLFTAAFNSKKAMLERLAQLTDESATSLASQNLYIM